MRHLSALTVLPVPLLAIGGCIDPERSPSDVSLADRFLAEGCSSPCHLEDFGEATRLDALEAEVSSATGRVCVVPSEESVAWAFLPAVGSRLLPVGSAPTEPSRIQATACAPAPVGEACQPADPGEGAGLFLLALEAADQAACDLLLPSDFELEP